MARSCRAVLRAVETLAPGEALALTKELLALRRSLRSTSLKLMLPLSRRRAGLPLVRSSVTAPTTSPTAMVGVSFVPLMVTVTG